jgi:hypothetical protein
MSVIWTNTGIYYRIEYDSERDLEDSILEVRNELFGPNRVYLDVKKKIGAKGSIQNIPDGYLIDLNRRKPQLYVVEVELASHDPLRHIAVQILQFSLSFEAEPRAVRTILFNALQLQPEAKLQCEHYAIEHEFRNLDHMLDSLVSESPFAALVVIDEMPDYLENVLARKFRFGVEVLQLARYENAEKGRFYHFEPFLADLSADVEFKQESSSARPVDTGEIDTVVVPAREDGFQETFIGENRWHAIRVHGTMRPQIKYIAVYRIRPISAITHIASVASIEPWKDTGKYIVNFTEAAKEIGPIPVAKGGRVKPLQNLRYTSRQRLENAKTLDDLW